jgi:hypothetical protein
MQGLTINTKIKNIEDFFLENGHEPYLYMGLPVAFLPGASLSPSLSLSCFPL